LLRAQEKFYAARLYRNGYSNMRPLIAAIVLVLPSAHAAEQGRDMPAQFVANRVFIVPQTIDGESIRFYSDTGGATFIGAQAAQRLHLTTQSIASNTADNKNAPPQMTATLPKYKQGFDIPLLDNEGRIKVAPAVEGAIGGDAFQQHFVMTIDYPNAVAYFRTKDCKPAKPKSAP
jgi:hypothetical protein